MSDPVPTPDQNSHSEAMKALQAEMRKKTRAARTKHGLLIVNTGNGKGKSTAGLGMLVRSISHGHQCAVMQFIKTAPDRAARVIEGPLVEWHACGNGFTWDSQDKALDIARCREGWDRVLAWLKDPEIDFILLDEMNVVLSFDYLPLAEVLEAFRNRPSHQHVVSTGRGAPEGLTAVADLITEMREVKHPFNVGVQAQAGIEF